MRAARTIVADDPVFGRICYGGAWAQDGDEIAVSPRDGVRRRLSVRIASAWFDLELLNGRFDNDASIRIGEDGRTLTVMVERFDTSSPKLRVRFRGQPGSYAAVAHGEEHLFTVEGTTAAEITLPAGQQLIVRKVN
ncbi:hypothetical protein [Sphingomonas desiccabilis]|uniref:hypothetical protein n=1 Tax=Sphingomonas desiccabilis TaxID=429134 RepID=UPI001F0F9620|nr:hypothetical protein [Sphingomonas desiccabilis]